MAVAKPGQPICNFSPTNREIIWQAFPCGLTLALSAQKGLQLPAGVAASSIGHRHMHTSAVRRAAPKRRWTPVNQHKSMGGAERVFA